MHSLLTAASMGSQLKHDGSPGGSLPGSEGFCRLRGPLRCYP